VCAERDLITGAVDILTGAVDLLKRHSGYSLGPGAVRARERRLLLSWAKAGKDSEGRSKATRYFSTKLGEGGKERERDVYN